MSVSFLPYVRDDVRDLWVIPSLARDHGDGFEVSVSNGNAVELLLALGLSPEPDGIFTLDAFSGLVTAALRRHLGQRSPEMRAGRTRRAWKDDDDSSAAAARVISSGGWAISRVSCNAAASPALRISGGANGGPFAWRPAAK